MESQESRCGNSWDEFDYLPEIQASRSSLISGNTIFRESSQRSGYNDFGTHDRSVATTSESLGMGSFEFVYQLDGNASGICASYYTLLTQVIEADCFAQILC